MANMTEKRRRRTIELKNPVKILSCANIGGEQEGEGPLKDWFDEIGKDGLFGEKTWEKAESEMQKRVFAFPIPLFPKSFPQIIRLSQSRQTSLLTVLVPPVRRRYSRRIKF